MLALRGFFDGICWFRAYIVLCAFRAGRVLLIAFIFDRDFVDDVAQWYVGDACDIYQLRHFDGVGAVTPIHGCAVVDRCGCALHRPNKGSLGAKCSFNQWA